VAAEHPRLSTLMCGDSDLDSAPRVDLDWCFRGINGRSLSGGVMRVEPVPWQSAERLTGHQNGPPRTTSLRGPPGASSKGR